MDKRSIFTTVAFSLVLLGIILLQRYAQLKYFPPSPVPAETAGTATGTGGPATAQTRPSASGNPGNPATEQAMATAGWHLMPAPASGPTPQAISLGSSVPDDSTYAIQLNLNPAGAGLSDVVLNAFKSSEDFMKPVKDRRTYTFQAPAHLPPANAIDAESLATRKVEVNGVSVDLSSAKWALESSDLRSGAAQSATYSVTLSNGDMPGLKILKTYTVLPINAPDGSKGYEVRLTHELLNLAAAPVTVKLTFNGPTLPPKEGGRGADRQVLASYRESDGIVVTSHPVEEFKKEKQEALDLTKNEKGPLAWIGACSVYFNAFVLPIKDDPNARGNASVGDFIENVTAHGWLFGDESVSAEDRPVTLTFTTTGQALAPGQSVSMPVEVYLGPKSREVLNAPFYASSPRRYDEALIVKSGWAICAIFTSEYLIKVMVALLTFFHWIAGGFAGHGDWGIAIILLVGVVRFLLHPITKRSQVQMMKMGKMGPEMERLKKKYADDKDELNKQMMQFYKAQGAAPILGCLPMFLQMPIWIALYSSLQSTFALRQSPFLWNFTWIHDLSKPDFLWHFPNHEFVVPLIGMHIEGLNLLPLLLGAVFYFQQKYMTPPNPAMTPEQLQQQKMMQMITPFIFPITLYNAPSGLNLYIFASTLFGVIESKIIRKHIKEREEAEKAERVIVDAKPTRQGKILARTDSSSESATPPGLFGGFWAKLQTMAEDARREQDRRKKNGGK